MDDIKIQQKARSILRHDPSDLNNREWKILKRNAKDLLAEFDEIPESDDLNALKKELETLLNEL
jgi:hypothetical protein